jgi:hypothetical protein
MVKRKITSVIASKTSYLDLKSTSEVCCTNSFETLSIPAPANAD